jgi:prepilin-type N-terminal cleavage/methylation domain-containing protein/prepilin-type processing-associated H-X9-DG protein
MSQRNRSLRIPHGFTLVELLVVIAIIGTLIALLLPAINAAREAGRRTQCANNLRQIGIALLAFEDANRTFPAGSSYGKSTGCPTWSAAILPFMEHHSVYDALHLNKPIYDASNQVAVTTIIRTYVCPTDRESKKPILAGRGDSPSPAPGLSGGLTNPASSMGLWYPGCMGPTQPDVCNFCSNPNPSKTNYCCQGCDFGSYGGSCAGGKDGSSVGMFGRWPRGFHAYEVTDGLSHTIMAGETMPGDFVWNGVFCPNFPVASTEIPLDTYISDNGLHGTWDPGTGDIWAKSSGYKSQHPGGVNFVMGDGSVHLFNPAIDYKLYNQLGTRAGGEAVQVPE